MSIACNNCRSRRLKCSASLPSCSRCVEAGKVCIYEQDDYRKKTVWKSRIDSLKSENDQLKSILDRLKHSPEAEAANLLQQLRINDEPPLIHDARVSQLPTNIPRQSNQVLPGLGTNANTPQSQLASSFASDLRRILPRFTSDDGESKPSGFRLDSLPSEEVTQQAVRAFFSCGATLFYVETEHDAEQLIWDVYHNAKVDLEHVAEVCALAAIGSQYNRSVSSHAREAYFHQACAFLEDAVRMDDLTSMRIFICLSMYSVMEKHHRARGMVAYGLKVARHNLLGQARLSGEDGTESGRLMRTLAFLECWLSFTLGHSFSLTDTDIVMLSALSADEDGILSPEVIRSHMMKIALLSAQIYSDICHEKQPCWDKVKAHLIEVDRWSQELPEALRLQTLLSIGDGMSVHRRMALFLVHIVHIGAHILLYEQTIKTLFNTSPAPLKEVKFAQAAADIHSDYTAACRQQAQIMRLLYTEDGIFQRCWLIIHAAFHCSVLLLLSISLTIILGHSRYGVDEDLRLAETCNDILVFCAAADSAADTYLCKLKPVLARVKSGLEKYGATPPPKTMSIESVVNPSVPSVPSDEHFAESIRQLVHLLLIPGRAVWHCT